MFGLFGKKREQPRSAMDALVVAVYGNPPPRKTAILRDAVRLAHTELLAGKIDEGEVQRVASDLDRGPMPYSTEDLALSTALNFFRRPDQVLNLQTAHLAARMKALEWIQEGKVAPLLVKTFEDSLYKIYKPR